MINFLEIEEVDRLLFFRYAWPAVGGCIQRAEITEEEVKRVTGLIRGGMTPEEKYENLFKVAMTHMTVLAKGKNKIDKEIIRGYFLFEHNKFAKDYCKTYYGSVKKIDERGASVETSLGIQRYRYDFAPDLQLNDIVIVHRGYVVEKVDEDLLVKIKKEKK
jgi:hydrogenase maturation factor